MTKPKSREKLFAVAYCKLCLVAFTIPAHNKIPTKYENVTSISTEYGRYYIDADLITEMDVLHDAENAIITQCKHSAAKKGLYWWGVIDSDGMVKGRL